MGNCQAIDTATLVIQHPSGKVDKYYWPVSASEVMRMNPGHYVALLISTTLCNDLNNNSSSNKDENKCPNSNSNPTTSGGGGGVGSNNKGNSVRLTRIKLLRPTDTLVLGQVYRLITTQDVMKGILAKKQAKKQKNWAESGEKPRRSDADKDNLVIVKHDKQRPRTTTTASSSSNSAPSAAAAAAAAARSRMWQPSLQSISEAAS